MGQPSDDKDERLRTSEDRYAEVLARQADSRTLQAIYRSAYGADHPAELAPFGFVTWTDLRRVSQLLALSAGDVLADLGTGRGGPGRWVASRANASLVGIDIVPAAVAAARQAASGSAAPMRFEVASMTRTDLPTGSCDAAMSIDALWMVWDKVAAVAEIARIVRPGGCFVCTTWEPAYLDHRELLADAGFDVLVREETPRWLSRQLAVYKGILAHRTALVAELGPEAAAVLVAEARHTPPVLPATPRVLFAARRQGAGASPDQTGR